MLQHERVNILIGNSFGSEGKGNIAAYIASKESIDIAISNNSPNAGHSFIDEKGEVNVVKMLPVSGILARGSHIILGPGSVINVARLLEEVEKYHVKNRLGVSPTAAIVDDYCINYEKENLQYISSTFQGSGAAIGLKAMRSRNIKLARDVPELEKFIQHDTSEYIIKALERGGTALCEVCQGYHLSVDSNFYPFTTSRQVNVGQALAYLDLPHTLIGNIIGISRSYWIRVGNVPEGYSGDVYPDSKEITWEDLSAKIGRQVKEMTTVTKRVRRVFTFSKIGFEMGVHRNGINIMFITFADYLSSCETLEMIKYLKNFDFEEIYFVAGFGEFNKNITRIK